MKTNLLKVSFLLVFSVNIFAQIDTTSLSYYPLNDGDYWEFCEEIEDWIYPPSGSIAYYSHEVIRDTTFSIGKTYKIIKRTRLNATKFTSYLFERIDSTTCNVYRYDTSSNIEFLIDSLKSQPGDSCNANRSGYYGGYWGTICTNIITDTIFSQETNSKVFIEQNSLMPVEYKLSQGFGLTYLNFYFE